MIHVLNVNQNQDTKHLEVINDLYFKIRDNSEEVMRESASRQIPYTMESAFGIMLSGYDEQLNYTIVVCAEEDLHKLFTEQLVRYEQGQLLNIIENLDDA